MNSYKSERDKVSHMNEHTIKELMEPIAAYINLNKVSLDDLHIVVANFFPDEDRLRQIAVYLKEHVPALRSLGLTDDKLFERTKQILTTALNEAALECLYLKQGEDEWDDLLEHDYADLDYDDYVNLDEADGIYED